MTIRTDVHSVSVLIPTYRDMHLLARSLPVYLSDKRRDLEVIILNNDPAQDVVEWLRTEMRIEPGERVRVLDMGSDTGFARAVNRGIAASKGELLFICDADLFPSSAYVETLCEFFSDHPGAGLAMGKILRYDLVADRPTEIIDSAGLIFSRSRRLLARGEGTRDTGQFDLEQQVFGIDGAAVTARRTTLESIALDSEYFDETFFMYKDDWDLSWRARLLGWECWYVPRAVATHARTGRGLGDTPYLSAIRAFRENERAKAPHVRFHSLKNQWLMLVKNEDLSNLWRDLPFILSRELLVVSHTLVFHPKALGAFGVFAKNLRPTLAKRHELKARQTVSAHELRRWLNRRDAPPETDSTRA